MVFLGFLQSWVSEQDVGAVGPTPENIYIRHIGKGLVSSVKKVLPPPTTDNVDWRIFGFKEYIILLSLPRLMHELCCFLISWRFRGLIITMAIYTYEIEHT